MRVLLINENRCRDNLIPYPLGIACIATAAREAGHEVSGLDLMFSDDPISDVAQSIDSFRPQCIGLSVRNIDNQDMRDPDFYLPQVKEIVETIKSETDVPVALGGAGFSIFPLECLEYLGLDMGIVGDGERSFAGLLEGLETGADLDDLPGLAFRRDGKGMVNPPGPYLEPESFPLPDRELFDVTRYSWTPGKIPPYVANLQARRGCHMRCIYCSTPRIEGTAMRVREAAAVADELTCLEQDYGIPTAFFADSLFDYPPDYTKELCREIKERELSLKFICSLNPLYTDLELLELLREAGCMALSIGNESGSEDILKSLKKGFSKEDVVRAVSGAKDMGFAINCFLLLGGPGENESTAKESVKLMTELEPTAVRVTVGIRVFPGCELTDIALQEGVISPGQNLLYPTFYLSRDTESWLHDYMVEACSSRDGWFIT
jgi:radical SAM superfamily enzyme YgiQ (UPF0313 family)